MKLPTPSTSHIPPSSYTTLGIYEPAEDSYLLLDTLSSPSETTFLHQRFNSGPTPLILEVGMGSGVVIAFVMANAGELFGREEGVLGMAVDVNVNAVREGGRTVEGAVGEGGVAEFNAKSTARGRGMFTNAILSDLTTAIKPGSVDVLIFNPPYVPTEDLPSAPHGENWRAKSSFERESQLLALAYAGGTDGMEITNRLLAELGHVLSARGVAYVLLCARNGVGDVMERLRGEGWGVTVAGESGGKGGWERLSIVRIERRIREME